MAASMAHISSYCSPAMSKLHRDFERRRKLAVAAKGGVAKKSSPLPPPPPCSASISRSPRREHVLAPLTPPLPSSVTSESIRKGAQVRVRTLAGQLPTGQRLVLWLSAVVVSAAEAGYLEVVYHGNFLRNDPFRTVHVARDQVKNMPSADSSAAPGATAAVPRPSSDKAPPRPTVAGKSLPVLKRLEKETRSQSEAILSAW